MYQLPQAVLGRIYEYDPTYRMQHQKVMAHLKDVYCLRPLNKFENYDFMESFTFQFSMYCASAVYIGCGIPIYAMICFSRLIMIVLGTILTKFTL